MGSDRIKAVIFDLGNVLIDFDHIIAARRISRFCKKTPEEIYGLFFNSKLTTLFEQGRISPPDFYLKVKEMLRLDLSYEAFVPVWNEIFFLSPKNRLVYNLAVALRARYSLALLSNINILHFEYLKKFFPVFDIFGHVFASCEMGLIKPDARIYESILKELKVLPGEAFYVDDRQELVESAKTLGMRAFVFKDVEGLKKDLTETGVDI
ncbi:MAG: HAD family phosphatase [Candidatus Omnitrophica bacterium]|nr:HAD family phosphatase [Candidatus Omnitrophota bacterium]